jgi:haloalkane dehalogenase
MPINKWSICLLAIASVAFGERPEQPSGKGAVRMNILRTPEDRFAHLPGYPFAAHHLEINGARMHYLDEGRGDPVLCLHGEPSWSYLYRQMIPILAQTNRVIAPDWLGFGKSDKPEDPAFYTFDMHHDSLVSLIKGLNLKRITLVCQDWGGPLGLTVAMEHPELFARLVIMNTGMPTGDVPMGPGMQAWLAYARSTKDMDIARVISSGCQSKLAPDVVAAYVAPFPDARYKAGAHRFPLMVPTSPDNPAVPAIKKARDSLSKWTKPTLLLFSDKDPVTAGALPGLKKRIPAAAQEPEIVIAGAGHFLQEDKGEEIAQHIAEFMKRRPIP